ncbi:MAG: glycosyltransferase family 4 protein [Actinomycetota bacterium]|nr:glycosyltransferase family 4 protein [Actinomycetota bacterium]
MELAKVLSAEHEVRLLSTFGAELEVPGVRVGTAVTESEVKELETWCDILVFQGFLLNQHPWLNQSSRPIVVDLYDPFHLEVLEQGRDLPFGERNERVLNTVGVVNQQLERGDFFLCASSRQRDFWLGQLTGIGRVNAHTYDCDKTLRSLIDVVPFGIDSALPSKDRQVLRGVMDGIGDDDRVLLWGGGLYPWFDPHTLVEAIGLVRARIPEVRLVFLAGRHPNPDLPPMPTVGEVRSLTAALGLDRHVFFVDHWVEYADRHNYLLEADLGVSTHLNHVEAEFSFRTRLLDYVWAGLPVVATGGDAMGEMVEREHVGRAVPAGDVQALASAIVGLLDDPKAMAACRERLADLASAFHWPSVAGPLTAFCRDPRGAADLLAAPPPHEQEATGSAVQPRLRRAMELTRRSLQEDGLVETGRRIALRVRDGLLPPVPSGNGRGKAAS